MKINFAIFKSYDIRGIYPEELNEDSAFLIGKAFVNYIRPKKICIARDARLSSDALFGSLIKSFLEEGCEIFNLGRMPTECLYFAMGNYDFDAGIMITASHNPKNYNGFKMLAREDSQIKVVRGKDLISAVERVNFLETSSKLRGELKEKDIWQDFVLHILSLAELNEIFPLKVVIDCSNGIMGEAMKRIQDNLPLEIIPLNFEPNGNFPNHSPNPLEKDATLQISETIKRELADFGLIFDGDGDRLFLLNENGEIIRADTTLLLLAKYFLDKDPGSIIVYNAICSKAVPEFIEKWGGKPIKSPVGFVNIRENLLKNNGVLGGEVSGHYCFKDHFYFDSGLLAMLILSKIISQAGKKVSEIVKDLSPYAISPEINFETKNKEEVLEKVKEKYKTGKQSFLDGLTVEYKDWWFNLRPSNTEPLLRLTIEAKNKNLLFQKQREITQFIKDLCLSF